ncbi:TPA: DNA repair protein RadC [Bacillus wiedmannii]|nr:DNA repair protein RadC [Bacillus cereus]PFC08167.1 DNA repair protein RadC [Bacillus cereus]PGU49503.1 DNA repair protein RadC [Bacillus cereus]HDX9655272.1 DNA repair protein RadC [Bacillus wiedmannii]
METVYEVLKIKQVGRKKKWKFDFDHQQIKSPENAAEVARHYIGDEDREVFFVICLDTKNNINAIHRAHVGSINSSVIHPREIFKCAILNNSFSVMFFHNHPSGDPTASPQDIEVTKRLKECGLILGVEVLDHIIIGKHRFVSLREKGYL